METEETEYDDTVERLSALSFEAIEKELPSAWSLEGWWARILLDVMKKKMAGKND